MVYVLVMLSPSIEDYLGAGAILSLLDGTKSPEANVCISAYKNSKENVINLIKDCSSGRELISMGFSEDVEFCSQINLLQEIPVLTKDKNGFAYFKDFNKN